MQTRDSKTGRFLPGERNTETREYKNERHKKYMASHPDQRAKSVERSRRWVSLNRGRHKENLSKILWRWKLLAITTLGGKCTRCGLEDPRILQVHHRNGDGGQERKTSQSYKFFRAIALGLRATDDLEILCANHNLLAEFEIGRRKVHD